MVLSDNELKELNRQLNTYALSLLRGFRSELPFNKSDLVADVILKFLSNTSVFDEKKGSKSAYLKTALKNQLLNALKNLDVRKKFESNNPFTDISQNSYATTQVDYDTLVNLIRKKLADDPIALNVFNALEDWGYSKTLINEKFGYDDNTFYGALRRIRTVVYVLMPSKKKEYE